MTRRRWIADEVSGNRAALTGKHAEHLARVLRAHVGQQFDLVTGEGIRSGVVSSVSEERVEFELGDSIVDVKSSPITLILAIFKFDRMEWAIEKCTELGVARIVTLVAQRSEPHLVAAATKRVERWQRLARQASEQSRRGVVPEISAPLKLRDLIHSPALYRIFLSELEKEQKLKDLLPPSNEEIVLAVGPEGGWTDGEIDSFRRSDWKSASLGPTILRAETAAIAALAITLSSLQ